MKKTLKVITLLVLLALFTTTGYAIGKNTWKGTPNYENAVKGLTIIKERAEESEYLENRVKELEEYYTIQNEQLKERDDRINELLIENEELKKNQYDNEQAYIDMKHIEELVNEIVELN